VFRPEDYVVPKEDEQLQQSEADDLHNATDKH